MNINFEGREVLYMIKVKQTRMSMHERWSGALHQVILFLCWLFMCYVVQYFCSLVYVLLYFFKCMEW